MTRPPIIVARVAVLASVAAGLVLSAGTASAGGSNLTLVNSSTYDFPADTNPVTACVDATFVANLPVGGTAAVEITAQIGHTVGFIPGVDQDCAGGPTFSSVVDLEPDATTTVALIRTSLTEGQQAVEWANDSRCYAPATGLLTLRNGAFTTDPVYVLGTIDGVERRIFDDVGENAQATVVLPTGTVVSNVLIVNQANDDLVFAPPDITVAGSTDEQLYVAGGASGSIGTFVLPRPGAVCAAPTTTTATSPPPAAAQATGVTPAFTG